jgi:hypothetical protein
MFLVPLVVIPAAAGLADSAPAASLPTRMALLAAALAVQTVLTEVLLSTYW